MIKYRTQNIRVPLNMGKHLDTYLEEGEEIIDILMETIIPAFDLRWLLLTNSRVIRVIYKWFEYSFHDVVFDGIDLQFTAGIVYDSIRLKSMTDDYRASFYALARDRTKEFMQKIEDERKRYQFDKMKEETKTEHRVKESLIVEGELSPDEDPGHKERLEKERRLNQSAGPKTAPLPNSKSDSYAAIKAIGELDDLKDQGLLTEDEYGEKKKEILDRM